MNTILIQYVNLCLRHVTTMIHICVRAPLHVFCTCSKGDRVRAQSTLKRDVDVDQVFSMLPHRNIMHTKRCAYCLPVRMNHNRTVNVVGLLVLDLHFLKPLQLCRGNGFRYSRSPDFAPVAIARKIQINTQNSTRLNANLIYVHAYTLTKFHSVWKDH